MTATTGHEETSWDATPSDGPSRKRSKTRLPDDEVLNERPETQAKEKSSTAITPCHCPMHHSSQESPWHQLTREEIDQLLWKEARFSTASFSNDSTRPSSSTPLCQSPEPPVNDTDRVLKRTDYLSWDDYFLAVAALSARRSKDPQTPMGACLVDSRNRIVGIGYNGFPRGCSDDLLPWKLPESPHGPNTTMTDSSLSPSLFVVHANVNAILNKCSADVAGCRLYCQSFPCHDCAKMIVQSRIQRVVYCRDDGSCGSCRHGDTDVKRNMSLRASRIILTMAGVELLRIQPSRPVIDLTVADMSRAAPCGISSSRARLEESGHEKVELQCLAAHRELLIREANYDPLQHSSARRPDSQVISWDDYFTSMAVLTAQRSKDPNTQVGACLVDEQKRIIGLGYNGFPAGCSDDDLPWARTASNSLHSKYPYVCHAEVNAILNKGSADVRGATLYVALFPCNECAKVIVQAGIREVVYIHDFYHDTDACRASRIMFHMAGVRLRRYIPTVETIRLVLGGCDCGYDVREDE